MSEQASEPVRRPRINPFVFPSETTLRFGLLVVFVLCGSAGFYGDFRGTQIQASEACAAQLIPKLLKLTSSMAGNDIHAVFAEVKVHFRSLAGCAALLRPQALWHLGGMGLVIVVAAIIYYLYPAWTSQNRSPRAHWPVRVPGAGTGAVEPHSNRPPSTSSRLRLESGRRWIARRVRPLQKALCGFKRPVRQPVFLRGQEVLPRHPAARAGSYPQRRYLQDVHHDFTVVGICRDSPRSGCSHFPVAPDNSSLVGSRSTSSQRHSLDGNCHSFGPGCFAFS